jgi:acyl-CoA dehydrogenase
MIERTLVEDAVGSLLAAQCTTEVVMASELGGAGVDSLWANLEELGFTLASVSEEAGGAGGSLADACAIARLAGRHVTPLPVVETDMLAGWLLAAAGQKVAPGPMTVAPVRRGERLKLLRSRSRGPVIVGHVTAVPWASSATTIAVLAEDERGRMVIAAVPAANVSVSRGFSIAGEPRDEIEFDEAPVGPGGDDLAPVEIGVEALQARGALTRVLLMLGALERVRDLTIKYAGDRVQFGRPIAAFQAVQQHLAEIARDVALARAAVETAVAKTPDGGVPSTLELAAAKVMCAKAARSVTRQAHQVHGAIGVTSEHPLQLFTRRLWVWRDEFGTEFDWACVAATIVAASPGGVWEAIVETRPTFTV